MLNFLFLFKIRLLAADGGSPRRTSTATVLVTVRRNLVRPAFVANFYNETILETTAVGQTIVTVRATDSDPQVFYGRKDINV